MSEPRVAGWSCEHLTITAGSVPLSGFTGPCGCDMQPVYAHP